MFEPGSLATRRRLLLGFGAGVALAVACSTSSGTGPGSTPDAGPGEVIDARAAVCPATLPGTGTACTQPEGTTCAFGGCDGLYAECTGGLWQRAPASPVPSGCPDGIPEAGAACPACFSADASCLYQQGCALDASAVRAACVGVTWQLTDDTCAVDSGAPSDAGGDGADASDGGTDAGVADAADAG